jgi:endonuclease/exonuclease/phosphatase family metal-dependent hydrolase
LNLGYLYKTAEVSITGLTTIYNDLSSPFPRPPVVTVATHTSGLEATFINLHLKCCGGNDNVARRTEASSLLQQYVETEQPNDPVIILGDYNDEITTNIEPTPFQNFIDAPAEYKFVDMALAEDENLGWSYPSWPSHIDHILVTNELFDNLLETSTLKFEDCNSSYSSTISDHRPVLMRLEL